MQKLMPMPDEVQSLLERRMPAILAAWDLALAAGAADDLCAVVSSEDDVQIQLREALFQDEPEGEQRELLERSGLLRPAKECVQCPVGGSGIWALVIAKRDESVQFAVVTRVFRIALTTPHVGKA